MSQALYHGQHAVAIIVGDSYGYDYFFFCFERFPLIDSAFSSALPAVRSISVRLSGKANGCPTCHSVLLGLDFGVFFLSMAHYRFSAGPSSIWCPFVAVELGQRLKIGAGFHIIFEHAVDCLIERHQQGHIAADALGQMRSAVPICCSPPLSAISPARMSARRSCSCSVSSPSVRLRWMCVPLSPFLPPPDTA